MKKNKKISVVVLIVLLTIATSISAYVLNIAHSNKQTINLGEQDALTVNLEILEKGKELIPFNATPTKDTEVKTITLKLNVVSDNAISFKIEHNIDTQLYSLNGFDPNQIHNSNGNYTLEFRLQLLKPTTDKTLDIVFTIEVL